MAQDAGRTMGLSISESGVGSGPLSPVVEWILSRKFSNSRSSQSVGPLWASSRPNDCLGELEGRRDSANGHMGSPQRGSLGSSPQGPLWGDPM